MPYTLRQISNNESLKKYSELTQTLLEGRGIKTFEGAEAFFAPNYEKDLHDPFLLKDMDLAVARILKAIDKEEKILIYSDYDADGVPGGAVLYDFFTKIGFKNFTNYIPHRHLEGFGLNLEAVDEFAKDKVKLVITVDCGVTDIEEANRFAKHHIDLIITDHHLPGENLPKAVAVVDTKRADCNYPNNNLCGAGVAFKLVQALLKSRDFGLKPGWEKWLLDLVGIATISDMVPLTGENRALAYYGLKVLRVTPRPGLVKLFRRLKIDPRNITEDDVGFSISPRINAASRLGNPDDAFNLLITTSETDGDRFAEHLEKLNNERKGLVAALTKEVKKIISERYLGENKRPVMVIGNPEWRPGLLGLAANSILDNHEGAVFLWGREGGDTGYLKGSCRSDGRISIMELFKKVPAGILVDYGGHSVSGGFTVLAEKVHLLEDCLCSAYEELSSNVASLPPIVIDWNLAVEDVNHRLWQELEKFCPFGIGNPKPLFLLAKVKLAEVKVFGKEKNHLELILQNGQRKVSAIAFFSTPKTWGREIKKGDVVDIVATVEKSTFMNRNEIRLRIEEVV
jgi:single-stranded-DNA-specific exonuclease